MFWFSGGINEAIVKSKSEGKVFLVFIKGNDEISHKMNALFESLSSKLSHLPIVAVRLESQSDNCKMFSQIYPVIVIPSTYFIDNKGIAIEIIGGSVEDETKLLDKINQTIEMFKKSLAPNVSQNTNPSNTTTNETPNPLPDTSVRPKTTPKTPNTSSPQISADIQTPSSSSVSPSVDPKVERANQLIEAIRQKKAKEEEEKQKSDEIERRKNMKEMQNFKRLREDMEQKEVIEEREREKREAKLAKDRVLAQIAADREERKARQLVFTESNTSEQSNANKTIDTDGQEVRQRIHTKTRIQFRLADGSTNTNEFDAKDSLEIVRQYVTSSLNIRSFVLSTTFPRREFGDNDYKQTLQELSLTPSAVLLVIQKSGVNSSRALSSPSLFWQTFTYLLTPFVMIWSFITSFFQPSSPSTEGSADSTNSSRPQQSNPKQFYNKDGNIARIRDPSKDSDEDNNTWNGNSTQQM